MKTKIIVSILLGIFGWNAAQARQHSLNTDGWGAVMNPATNTFTWSGSSITETTMMPDGSPLPPGLSYLSLTPGTSMSTYTLSSVGLGTDMFVWQNPTNGEAEQIVYEATGANSFTLDFNYAEDLGCSGETASLVLNTTTFSTSNPCTKGPELKGKTAAGTPYDYINDHFSFDITSGGKVQLIGSSPWATTTSAPEIDANSSIAALSLLAGGIAVIRSRRRSLGTAR
jgi:hypothetical protein